MGEQRERWAKRKDWKEREALLAHKNIRTTHRNGRVSTLLFFIFSFGSVRTHNLMIRPWISSLLFLLFVEVKVWSYKIAFSFSCPFTNWWSRSDWMDIHRKAAPIWWGQGAVRKGKWVRTHSSFHSLLDRELALATTSWQSMTGSRFQEQRMNKELLRPGPMRSIQFPFLLAHVCSLVFMEMGQ